MLTRWRSYKVVPLLAVLLLLIPLLAACGGSDSPSGGQATSPTGEGQPTTPAASGPGEATSPPDAAPTTPPAAGETPAGAVPTTGAPSAPPTGGEFHGAWPFQLPPIGHYNTFATNSITLGAYWDMMEMPLASYKWADAEYVPMLATAWEVVAPDTFNVTLREGVKWSDGKPFTSKDVVTTFQLLRLQNGIAWNYLGSVAADGDYGVTFKMKDPSSVVQRYVLREHIRSDATYNQWATQAQALFAKNAASDSKEVTDLRTKFEEFRPQMVVSGPYKIDTGAMTEAQLSLSKVPTAWNANIVQFDKIVLYNGETPAVTPIVLSKQVDYATHGFPPATEKAFEALGIRVVRPPVYSGPALFFNYAKVKAVADPRVRQAIAMAINKETNATISLGKSAKVSRYMTGVADSIIERWVSEQDLAAMKPYEFNLEAANQLMGQAGFKKEGGVWVSPQGERMEYELVAPAEFADWSAAARNLADQLTQFGVKTTLRTITFTQYTTDFDNGRFQLGIQAWGAANPHPHFSFVANFLTHNAPTAPGPGMAYALKQNTESVGQVDLNALTIQSAQGLDEEKQKATVTKLAQAFNELLPVIPLWERYGNNPALPDVRVTNWPPDDDPIYQNSPYSDNFVVLMILEGTLKGRGQ